MAVRISTLAEVKVLSLPTLMYGANPNADNVSGTTETTDALAAMRKELGDNMSNPGWLQGQKDTEIAGGQSLFKTIGIARSVQVDEDYGTSPVYGIGAPTRPRLVPNNYSVNVTVDRLQLDRRRLSNFMTTPEYWYSDTVQRDIGIDDMLLYTFFFIRSKEDNGSFRSDIYALMPRSSSVAYTSGDIMTANRVSLVGFKYSYKQAFFDYQNLVNESVTQDVRMDSQNSGGR